MERTNSGLVSCLLAASLCSTGLGHGVLLQSNFGFRICKCLADRRWAERDCQTQHRTRLEKATARSVVWLLHCVLLSSSSGFLGCAVIVPYLPSPLSALKCITGEDKVARSLRVTGEAGFHQTVVAKRAVFVEVTEAPAARRGVL